MSLLIKWRTVPKWHTVSFCRCAKMTLRAKVTHRVILSLCHSDPLCQCVILAPTRFTKLSDIKSSFALKNSKTRLWKSYKSEIFLTLCLWSKNTTIIFHTSFTVMKKDNLNFNWSIACEFWGFFYQEELKQFSGVSWFYKYKSNILCFCKVIFKLDQLKPFFNKQISILTWLNFLCFSLIFCCNSR